MAPYPVYFSIDWTCHLDLEVQFTAGSGHISPVECSSCISEHPAQIQWWCHVEFLRAQYLGRFSSSSTQLTSYGSSKVTIYICMLMTHRFTVSVRQDSLWRVRAVCQQAWMMSHSGWNLIGYRSRFCASRAVYQQFGNVHWLGPHDK